MANDNGNRNGNGHGKVDYEYIMFAKFLKANSSSFRGIFDPDIADEWIKEMEKIFSILTCIEEQKGSFAAYMLKADAEFWSNGTKSLLDNVGIHINWEAFKMTFYKKYFLAFVRRNWSSCNYDKEERVLMSTHPSSRICVSSPQSIKETPMNVRNV